MSNCHFAIDNRLFRQVIRIPTDSNKHYIWIIVFYTVMKISICTFFKNTNIYETRRFSNFLRFIDDLDSTNGNGEFENSYLDIYPPDLEREGK